MLRLKLFFPIIVCFALGVEVHAQITNLYATDGRLDHLAKGYTYTLNPDTSVKPNVTPSVSGTETGTAIRFRLIGEPGTSVRVSFTLPGSLWGHGNIYCLFDTNSAYVLPTGTHWNPYVPHSVVLDGSGTAFFYLGLTVNVPPYAHGSYWGSIVCTVTDSAHSSSAVVAGSMTVTLDSPSLNVNPSDGELDALSRGYTYTLDADPNNPYPVTPLINYSEGGVIAQYSISAKPGTKLTVEFRLPTILVGDILGALPCTFTSNSIYVEETTERWNPNTPHTVTVGNNGTMTLDLGITVTVPGSASGDAIYYGVVGCVVTDDSSGASISTGSMYYASVISSGLGLNVADGVVDNVLRGFTYTLNPDPRASIRVTPVISGNESGSEMVFVLSAMPGTMAQVDFTLPTSLIGQVLGVLKCSFALNSVFVEETSERWSPKTSHTIVFGMNGVATLHLGMTVSVPSNVHPGDSYSGVVVCTISDSGGGSLSNGATYMVNVSTDSLSLRALPGSLANLSAGNQYTLDPNPAVAPSVKPIVNGTESGNGMTFTLAGSPGSLLFVEFTLPGNLYDSSRGSLPCLFDDNSAYLEETGDRWNPNLSFPIEIGTSGIAHIRLGARVIVFSNARTGDSFSGIVVCTASIPDGATIAQSTMLRVGVSVSNPTGVTDQQGLPETYSLEQNYPNPFNPSTRIDYTLPAVAFVSLKVYNTLGQEIAKLVNEVQEAGYKSVSFIGNEVPSGVYTYRLAATSQGHDGSNESVSKRSFVGTGKMLLIK